MKTITKLALIVAIASFAIVANASTLPTATGTTTQTVTAGIAETQVDWVTVGATMPYKTSSSAQSFDDWTNAVTSAFAAASTSLPTHMPTFSTQWSVANWTGGTGGSASNETNIGTPGDDLVLTWGHTGAFRLTATTRVQINSADVGCSAAVRHKHVFVVPAPYVEPHASLATGNGAILGCNVTEQIVRFEVMGIGQRQLKYTISRRPMTGTTTTTDVDFNVGDARAEADFTLAQNDFESALTIAANRRNVPITVDNLQPGYIYTVAITEVSDQISRKSQVGTNGFLPVSGVQAVFAVVPTPEGSRIEHITNVGH